MAELLPRKLRLLRAERGLTLAAAAERTGITRETLGLLERGKRHPHAPTLHKIAQGYSVPVEELLELEEKPQEELIESLKADTPEPPRECLERLRQEEVLRFRIVSETGEVFAEDVSLEGVPPEWVSIMAELLSDIRLAPGDRVKANLSIRMTWGDEEPETVKRYFLEVYAEQAVKVPVLEAA